jgi:hypothetical protein
VSHFLTEAKKSKFKSQGQVLHIIFQNILEPELGYKHEFSGTQIHSFEQIFGSFVEHTLPFVHEQSLLHLLSGTHIQTFEQTAVSFELQVDHFGQVQFDEQEFDKIGQP